MSVNEQVVEQLGRTAVECTVRLALLDAAEQIHAAIVCLHESLGILPEDDQTRKAIEGYLPRALVR